ncbi:RTA1-domain-containing protein [Hypoxylon crocopeplum]|nr:RTA1-domain-containing protein [Hypoxylon crocopeplum]
MVSHVDCAVGHCSRIFLMYEPSLAGNVGFLVLFAVLIPLTLALGIKYRSSIFATTIATGLALEVLGYIGRVLLHNNPTERSAFILFLIGTVTAPTLICGAIFIVIPRVVAVYGEEFRSWKPIWYPFLFRALTAASLLLQLAGGLLSTIRDDLDEINTGIRILVVGLAVQLLALAIFVGHATLFAIAVRTRHHALDMKFAGIYNSGSFKAFVFAFTFATFLLIFRTAYRLIVIAEGYGSSIAQSETLLLVLDGTMVLLATLLMLAFFPGRILGNSFPQASNWRISKTSPQPILPAPYEMPSTRSSPTYNRMSIKSVTINYSPRKSQYPAPIPQSSMVDNDALW